MPQKTQELSCPAHVPHSPDEIFVYLDERAKLHATADDPRACAYRLGCVEAAYRELWGRYQRLKESARQP